jgi:hypothetical protein
MKLNYSREEVQTMRKFADSQTIGIIEDLLTMHNEAERLRNRILGATWDDDYVDI